MAERPRIISPEPRLAKFLRTRRAVLVPSELYDWTLDWVEDVGSVMRSRENIVYSLASAASYGLLITASKLFPMTTKLGIVSEALGLRR